MLDFLFSISPEALLSASLGLATILLAVWVKMYIHGRKELSLRANDLSELLKNYQEEAKNLSVYIEKRLKNIDSTYRVSPDSRKQIAEKIKVLATQFNGGLRKPIQKFIAKYECELYQITDRAHNVFRESSPTYGPDGEPLEFNEELREMRKELSEDSQHFLYEIETTINRFHSKLGALIAK